MSTVETTSQPIRSIDPLQRVRFQAELKGLINKYGLDSEVNTPDDILANYLVKCFEAFEFTEWLRDKPPLTSSHASKIPERGDSARVIELEAKLKLAKQLLWREGDEGPTGGEALAIPRATASPDPSAKGEPKL